MGTMTSAQFLARTDKLTAAMLAAIGTSGSGFGLGDSSLTPDSSAYGYDRKLRDLVTLELSYEDYDQQHLILETTHQLVTNAAYQAKLPGDFNAYFSRLNALCVAAGLTGVTNINTFATYYNSGSGGPNAALLAPDFRTLFNLIYPGTYPSARNVYSPAITNIAQMTVGGSFVAGTAVDTTKYAGAARSQVTTTSFTGASDTVTVTGVNQSGQSGRTWTATVAANGTVALTPTVAGDLIVSVTGITIGANITGGLVVVGGLIPSSRSNPPT